MKEYTQTSLRPGNCWQTAVASILEVDPETLPSQVEIEKANARGYWNALNAYLFWHHGMQYAEFQPAGDALPFGLMLREPGFHLLCGPTVRTPETGDHHVVVAQHGRVVWDPHPSRAGLAHIRSWGLVGPLPDAYRATWEKPDWCPCVCPTCAAADGIGDRKTPSETPRTKSSQRMAAVNAPIIDPAKPTEGTGGA